jgi:hypothetical protein
MVGVVLSVSAALVSVIGYSLQKHAHLKNSLRKSPLALWHQPVAVLGIALIALEMLIDVSALAFASESLVASLGALTIAFNSVAASRFLGEKLSWIDLIALISVLSGSTLCAIFASHNEEHLSWVELRALFTRHAFLTYAAASALIIGLLNLAANASIVSKLKSTAKFRSLVLPISSGYTGALVAMFAKAL